MAFTFVKRANQFSLFSISPFFILRGGKKTSCPSFIIIFMVVFVFCFFSFFFFLFSKRSFKFKRIINYKKPAAPGLQKISNRGQWKRKGAFFFRQGSRRKDKRNCRKERHTLFYFRFLSSFLLSATTVEIDLPALPQRTMRVSRIRKSMIEI